MQKLEKPKKDYKIIFNYFKKEIEIPKNWNYPKYKDILIEVEDPISLNDEEEYKLITVKRYNQGLVLREILKGKDILTKDLYSVGSGDFIIAKMQIIHGACGLVPKSLVDAKISGSYIRFKSKESLDLEYLNWFSQTPFFSQQTFVSSIGSNLEKMNFNKKHWLNHSIPLPLIKEQKKIVSILNHVFTLINQTRKVIIQTGKCKKGLRKNLLTKGIGHEKFKKIKFLFNMMETPIDWKWDQLTSIFDLQSGSTPSRSNPEFFKGDIPWVTSGDLNRGLVQKTIENISTKAVEETSLTVYPKGTFLIAIYGLEAAGTRGKFGILDMDATINQACMAFIGDKIDIQFFSYFYEEFGERIAFNYAQGTKQQNLSEEALKFLDVPIPSKDEQQKISSILLKFDERLNELKRKNHCLEILKKGLMQKLLTGQILV